ncbi:MAG: autotransporter outer membrane beta-barrel domain-containing protein [Candidatus Kapaibacterium sp.]
MIADYGRGDFLTNARAILLQSVERYQSDLGRELLNFMANRKGTSGWLSPEEELLTYVLLSEGQKLSDIEWVAPRLQRRAARPGPHGIINDNLYTKLLERLRRELTNVLRKVEDGLEEEVERRFVEVVVNNLSVKGVRKTEDVNSLVDQFVEEYPESPYVRTAQSYLYLRTDQELLGAGLFAGYASGGMILSEAEVAGKAFGPSFSGELYVDRFVLSGTLFAGILSVSDSFAVADRFWSSGDASLTGASLDAGYELRFGNLMLTPFLGGTLYELREPREGSLESLEGLSTGSRLGFQSGVMVGWRIPFDQPPHIDLRLRLSMIQPGLSSFHPAFDGSIFLATLSFGLIQRPYTTLPATSNGR